MDFRIHSKRCLAHTTWVMDCTSVFPVTAARMEANLGLSCMYVVRNLLNEILQRTKTLE